MQMAVDICMSPVLFVPMNSKPSINEKKCNLCGRCIEICPKQVLVIIEDRVEAIGKDCMLCSHCYSVCRRDAIVFDGSLRNISFKRFKYFEHISAPGDTDPGHLVNIIRSRRSIRKFKDKPVPDGLLLDLVEFASTAPSGSNCQDWEFVIMNSREKVFELAGEIGRFFIMLNKIVRNPLVRYLSFIVSGKRLIHYYRNNYESVLSGLAEAKKGKDPLFHGAPSLVIVHSAMDGSLPVEDAQYASYNITLLAHSLGLGTCYIGYASEVLNASKKIRAALKIPKANRVHAVLAVGYPDVVFHRPALRKPYTISRI